MATTEPIPVDRYLVPADPPALPDGFIRLSQPIVRGIPFEWPLETDLSLVLFVPTGVASLWRDADPRDVVSAAADQVSPYSTPVDGDPLLAPPSRLLVRRAAAIIASIPLAARHHRIAPDGGGEVGSVVEIVILDWLLHAGCFRGVGDFGSFVEVAWRRADRGATVFLLPPLDPRVAARSDFQSDVGIAPPSLPSSRGGYLP